MSHSMLFFRIEGDEVASIPYDSLLSVLHRHGFESVALQEGVNHLPYPVDETAAGSEVSIHVKAGTVTALFIRRPGYDVAFRAFSFELISKLELVMFPDYGGELHASAVVASELPESMKCVPSVSVRTLSGGAG
jgi:hypothetical protein